MNYSSSEITFIQEEIMIKFLVITIFLYLFLICPKLRHKNNMNPFCSAPVAHRGIHDNITVAENSIPAFIAAVEAGCGIELDVQFTKDRRLVVFHDDDLTRLCGDGRLLIDVTYDELCQLKLLETCEHIPLLSEVLEAVDGRVPIIIEMKNALNVIWEMPYALYGVMKHYPGIYAIESFNPLFIRKYKKLDKTVARGVLSYSFKVEERIKRRQKILATTLANLMWNFLAKPDFIAYKMEDHKKIAFRINRFLGATTVAWGLPDSATEIESMKKYFDGFICDLHTEEDVENAAENVIGN